MRHIAQWKRIESSEVNLHLYEIFIYDKEGKNMQYNGEKTSSSIDGIGETRQTTKRITGLPFHIIQT